jgi:nucleoside-diphosphate kinase
MAIERTLSIIKPDAVAKNVIGEIYARFEKAGLRIVAARMLHLTREQAEEFYAVHKERPFFGELVEFMTSGPGDGAGARRRGRHRAQPRGDGRHRPQGGRAGHHPRRFRRRHVTENAVHGSDGPETAARRSPSSSSRTEICPRTR